MPFLMGGTVCEPTDQTDYCKYSRNFHMLSMAVTIIFIIDFLMGGHLINLCLKRWKTIFLKNK